MSDKDSDSQAIEALATIIALAILLYIFGFDGAEQIAKIIGFDR